MARVLVSGAWRSLDDVVAILNHPGHSSQKSHGRKGGSGFDERAAAARSGRDALHAAPAGLGADLDGPSRGMTDAQAGAVREYRSVGGYLQTNRGLRSGDLAPATAERVRHLDAAMTNSRLTGDVVVHRGVRGGADVFGDRLGGDLTGATWTEAAYLSTSPSGSFAAGWAREGGSAVNPVAMRILAPKGTGGIAASDVELVLDRGLTLRVAADRGVVDGVRMLDVEVAS